MQNKLVLKVHISFDDVILMFQDLEKHDYNSIFQQRFLRRLQYFHNKWGCRFTLYVFIEFGNRTLKSLPWRYMDELSRNADWLKFGYHGYSPEMLPEKFKEGYMRFRQFLGPYENMESHTIRLHKFYASENEVAFLNKHGIQIFLTADDERVSYDLNDIENDIVRIQGIYEKDNPYIQYRKTNIRLESSSWRNGFIHVFAGYRKGIL